MKMYGEMHNSTLCIFFRIYFFCLAIDFCRTTDNCSFRIVHLLWSQFFTWIHTPLIGREFSFLWQWGFCSLLPLFQKYKQIPLTSELELTVETGDCIFKTCFPPQMASCQQVRRNILQNLLCSRLQFYSEVFVFGEISSRTNALS